MKHLYFLSFFAALIITSCGGSSDTGKSNGQSKDPSSDPNYQKGLALVGGSDCATCHRVAEKMIGPSYQDIANKYEGTDAQVSSLAQKILKGGAGVWGQVPMTAHPALSQADAETMVRYILLLK
ncbi:MAG: c-type cytochrome [Bacteroidota bacterium]